jgi:asparagine synthase (glutamine-hydrolysing)
MVCSGRENSSWEKGFVLMCGFTGWATKDPNKTMDSNVLDRILAPLARRGPDSEGKHFEPGCAFGHRRLKVVDLEGGEQPMCSEDGRWTLVYNGEIYNFRELRQQLESVGHSFKQSSDTEVLLHGCQEWGMEVLPRLIGMFAFALWDRKDRQLWLVRDRLGVKPLYYACTAAGDIVFGSEATACLKFPGIAADIDEQSAFQYFAFGYVPGGKSIFRSLQKLPPGTFIKWQDGQLTKPQVYWNLIDQWGKIKPSSLDENVVLDEFSHRFSTAVKDRLISDVPLGAFLSGGLDSGCVVHEMSRNQSSVSTFSIGFTEPSFNEAPEASVSAHFFGSDHHEQYVSASNPSLLLEIAGQLDEPLADTSIVPTYALCREARRYLTVALSGDGGDELLAGYRTHQANAYYQMFRKFPSVVARNLARAVQYLPDFETKVNFVFQLKRFSAAYPMDAQEAHASWRLLTTLERFEALSKGPSIDLFSSFRLLWKEAAALSELDRALYVDYKTWLLDDILVKVDRASMNHGLEVRSPFLDHRLIEFVTGLPARFKCSIVSGKKLLRRYAAEHGLGFIAKRKKSGFNAPVSSWLRGPWHELAQTAFEEWCKDTIPFISEEVVLRAWHEHMRRYRDHGYFLFGILMYILWRRNINQHIQN